MPSSTDDLVNMSSQFSGLPMKDLIGGPLQAACDAQTLLASASANSSRTSASRLTQTDLTQRAPSTSDSLDPRSSQMGQSARRRSNSRYLSSPSSTPRRCP